MQKVLIRQTLRIEKKNVSGSHRCVRENRLKYFDEDPC